MRPVWTPSLRAALDSRPSKSTLRAAGLVATLALLWGSGFFWIKLSLGGFTPTQLTFGRLALGALALWPIVLIRRLARPRGRMMWAHLALSALTANAVPYTLFAIAEQTVSSSLAGVINSTTPLWTVLIAFLAGVDRPVTRRRLLGLALGFAGAVVVLSPWDVGATATIGGVLACLGAAASYGVSFVYQGRFLTNRGVSPLTLVAAQLTISTAMLALTLPITGRQMPRPDATALGALLVLGIFGTGLALVIAFTLLATEGPTAASTVTYLLPAVALALGSTILGEQASWTLPIGALAILAGVALVRRRPDSARIPG